MLSRVHPQPAVALTYYTREELQLWRDLALEKVRGWRAENLPDEDEEEVEPLENAEGVNVREGLPKPVELKARLRGKSPDPTKVAPSGEKRHGGADASGGGQKLQTLRDSRRGQFSGRRRRHRGGREQRRRGSGTEAQRRLDAQRMAKRTLQ